jgi:hypothetical protein
MTDAPERIWALIPPASPAMSGGWRDTVPPAHWGADAVEYRRADAPPTLAEAMTVPEVRALLLSAWKVHHRATGATLEIRKALKPFGALANLKGPTP